MTDKTINRRDILQGSLSLATGLAIAQSVQTGFAEESKVPFQLKKMTQVAFIVKDIETSKKEFAKLYGQDVPQTILTGPLEETKTVYRGKPTEARAKLAFFKFGDLQMELIEPVGGPSTWKEQLDKHGEGFHHLAFNVESMKEAIDGLTAQGGELVQTGDFGSGCYAYVDMHSSLKTVIELLEIY